MATTTANRYNYFVLICFIGTLIQSAWTKPYEKHLVNDYNNNRSRCDKNGEIDTNCQKCAKVTKSEIVYPMCCADTDDVYHWCYKYLNFGLQKRAALPPDRHDHPTVYLNNNLL